MRASLPAGEEVKLEDVPCPVCSSRRRSRVITGVDALYGLPGTWDVYRCRECSHAFTSPRPTQESIGVFYPAEYSEHQKEPGRTNPFSEANADLVTRLDLPPGRVLDVGCAAGAFMASMQRRGWHASGIEPSAKAAALASRSTGAAVYSSIGDPSLEIEGTFDAITLWSSLEHTHSPDATLRRLRSLIAPDGRLIGVVPNFQSFERKVFRRYWFALDLPRHLQHFGPTSLVRTLTDAGFDVLEVNHASGHDNLRWSLQRRLAKKSSRGARQTLCWTTRQPRVAMGSESSSSRFKRVAVQGITRAADRLNGGSQLTFVARPSTIRG